MRKSFFFREDDQMKITDQQLKILVWVVAFIGVVVLIALNKLPVDALKYVVLYAAGTLGGSLKLPGIGDAPAPPGDQNGK